MVHMEEDQVMLGQAQRQYSVKNDLVAGSRCERNTAPEAHPSRGATGGHWNSSMPWEPIARDNRILGLGQRAGNDCLYSPPDTQRACRIFKANCGPAAFAAVMRCTVCQAINFFPHFPERPWTTQGDMQRAFTNAGVNYCKTGEALPYYGVALIQITGPWSEKHAHPCAALSKTHWVGVYRDCFYDVNWDGWLPSRIWEDLVLPDIVARHPLAIGWRPRMCFSVPVQLDEASWSL